MPTPSDLCLHWCDRRRKIPDSGLFTSRSGLFFVAKPNFDVMDRIAGARHCRRSLIQIGDVLSGARMLFAVIRHARYGIIPDSAFGFAGIPSQRWSIFVRNHARSVVACDFFVSVTATFRIVYVFVVMEIGSRRILHCNVTRHPTARMDDSTVPRVPGLRSSLPLLDSRPRFDFLACRR